MSDDTYCRLCVGSADLIEIFGEHGARQRISEILGEHFWFKVNRDDFFSKSICTTCWRKVESFHVFYVHTKLIQKNLELMCKKKNIAGVNEAILVKEEESEEAEYLQSANDDEDSIINIASTCSTVEIGSKAVEKSEIAVSQQKQDHRESQINARRSGRVRKRTNTQSLQQDELIRNWCDMQCIECPVMFYRFPEMKIHYRDVHQRNGFVVCCKKKFFRRVRALEHIERHYDPNIFRCEPCNKNFADKPGLMNHMDGHVPNEERCFQCIHCPRTYAKKFQLDQHARLRHITEGEKKFVCEECGKTFANNSILQTHIRGVHENINVYICEICAKAFKNKSLFERHGLQHSNIEQPRIQCHICNQWLKHEDSLRSHLSRHSDTKHECDLCGKISPNRGALRSHKRYVHFSDATHQCTVCEKMFKKPIALREHMAVHTGETLYTCSMCPKTFKSSANMHSHKKKKHFAEWKRNKNKK